jgi:hypothetical protein
MNVMLRVAGHQLLARVTAEMARIDSAFPRHLSPAVPLHWHIETLPSPLDSACLAGLPMQSLVVLMEVRDESVVDSLWSATCRDYHAIARDGHAALVDQRQPLVFLIFDRELTAMRLPDLPPLITDWVNGIDATQELAQRIVRALKRGHRHGRLPDNTQLALELESRRLCYGGDSVTLTACEISVAELFLSKFGSVIPLEEIQLLFRLAGRSVEGSNVRVAMFQLRFKIEALTHCQYTLTSAYGLGYVLKHGKAGGAGKPAAVWPARHPT